MEGIDTNKVIEEFEALTKDAGRVQRETLKKILEENGSAEYLQNLGLNGRTDPESFKSCVPLVTHKDLEAYIHRIADGDSSSILTGKPIPNMSLSSGTTQGKRKFVPFNDELMENTLQIFRTSFAFRNREFPLEKGKSLQFVYSSKPGKTKGGLALTNIVLAFRTFEQVWEELCNDIRDGELSSRVTAVSNCFPNAKYIYGIMTGSMEPYLKKLRHYAGELPLMSADYGSSEGWIAANVNPKLPPEMATFAVLPNIGYFEFIPLEDSDECVYKEPRLVGLTEVKIGEDYEIVVTNFAGTRNLSSQITFPLKLFVGVHECSLLFHNVDMN
ncbi:JASMONIC ACID-AMIDO SYNTHETASE JAR1-LIKE ISOFORM X1 [Salix viminalis]|uniref:JASMONIC ACID-AMIDO SYNTHETASE JAR1-LIKE ISOFORM X1 n=1 Tax=Salix viminalis TaxID=40686 RepID=A0A9Q0ZCR4_SALVM|nr:JASMONIC ACID-AMIDO SYNTHETASE JAR1-LIKE ISOFORM X1 [Salix viminalis]